ncbi:MAG TPA: hypothetical protein VH643_23435 [Gemmataceae bacterium]|jgi:hypothetical protein
MSKTIYQIVDELPAKNFTTRVLHALDWVVPGEWKNLVGFENTIKTISGEDDQKMIQKIGERAIALYNDRSQGYQRALWLYQMVDHVQGLAGWAQMAHKVGEHFSLMSWLSKITPKTETTAGVDLAVKLTVELVAFCQLNGIPGDSVADFVKSLSDYRDEALMRMAAVICFDGILPLGPGFLSKGLGLLQKVGAGDLEKNERFKQVRSMLPGKDTGEQLGLMQRGLDAIQGWVSHFVSAREISVDKIAGGLKGFLEGIEGKLQFVAAFLDMTTNYYEHTGTQTVARSLITRAAGEI